jgi:hypothetical protein
MIIAWSFSCEILELGISHLPMTSPKSTISEPYKHLRIAKAFMVWYRSMAKAPFLGVVSFGRFDPDWGSSSVTMLTVMVNLPQNS